MEGRNESWIVLELGGFTLHDLILASKDAVKAQKRHCLEDEGQVVIALQQITAALAFLHSRLFVHGDMKPANVMWFEHCGRWKLIDMDGLRITSEVVDMKDADFYTAIYAAPELAAAVVDQGPLRLSRRLDVWSAGLCLVEMKTLQPLLQSKFESVCSATDGDALGDFFQWLRSSDDPLEDVMPGLRAKDSEVLQVVMKTMLVVDPSVRGLLLQIFLFYPHFKMI